MSKISTNIEEELLKSIIIKIKSGEISFYNKIEKDNHKLGYFDFDKNSYFIHSLNGTIDVINKLSTININEEKEELINYKTVTIFSDGACQPNPGESGSGIAIYHDSIFIKCFYGMYLKDSTNNIAELKALYESLKIAKEYKLKGVDKIFIKTDSKYSIDCLTTWIDGWLSKNWLNSKKQPIKNRELIEPMYKLYLEVKNNIELQHVYGHSGVEGNELADRMAVLAIDNKTTGLIEYKKSNVSEILSLRSAGK